MLGIDGSVWELAHEDGASIFVQHKGEGECRDKLLILGPFLFTTLEELEESEGTLGPYDLLSALDGKDILAQQISKTWVVEHALAQFDPIMSDVVIIGELLIPLTLKGATFADEIDGPEDHPWQGLVNTYGEDIHRLVIANLVSQMFDQTVTH